MHREQNNNGLFPRGHGPVCRNHACRPQGRRWTSSRARYQFETKSVHCNHLLLCLAALLIWSKCLYALRTCKTSCNRQLICTAPFGWILADMPISDHFRTWITFFVVCFFVSPLFSSYMLWCRELPSLFGPASKLRMDELPRY